MSLDRILLFENTMERVIQQTDYDALSCRMSAITKGYLPSPTLQVEHCHYELYKEMHVEYFRTLKNVSMRIHSKANRMVKTSFPVMNYGTYLRTVSIDLALNDYLTSFESDKELQVVNLGCGSDLRMIPLLKNFPKLTYVDVDYESSIRVKSNVLWGSETLRLALNLQRDGETGLVSSDRYKLVSCDLNRLDATMKNLQALTSSNRPTVIITECVLCYMHQKESQQLIENVMKFYNSGLWISYDPIGGSEPNDRFGTIMQANLLESRNLEMPTLMIYNSTEKYAARFPTDNASAEDMWEIFSTKITRNEMERLRSLQFLDEIEELKVMQTHYILLNARW